MTILDSAAAMAFALSGGLDNVADPGWYVSKEEVLDYAAQVTALIHDMSVYLDAHPKELTPSALKLWPPWMNFRLEWAQYKLDLDGSWYVGAGDWTRVREFHKYALQYRTEFERAGVQFTAVEVVPLPADKPGGPVQEKPADKPAPIRAPAVPVAQVGDAPAPKASPASLGANATTYVAIFAVGVAIALGTNAYLNRR